ncbi:MAG: DegQ family serine endoprotease, partial [Pseudomonadota bacterium]
MKITKFGQFLPKHLRHRQIHILVLLGVLFWGFLMASATVPARAHSAPDSFADLIESLQPTVVSIFATRATQQSDQTDDTRRAPTPGGPLEEFFKRFGIPENGPQSRPQSAAGSGFILDPDGIIITNNHVIEGSDEILVRLSDDREFSAEIVGRDARTDIAVLKIEAKETLPFAKFGQSDKSRVGDWVIAIGNPLGLGGTVTAGIISARGRDISSGPYDDYIQTDAPINSGNSGGPLFNMQGEVIGINTAIFTRTGGSIGIGFAIPEHLARGVIAQLREFGTTKRGWLGISLGPVTDEIAESLGLDEARGALVSDVNPTGPAFKANLQVGDIILGFDTQPIDTWRVLPRIVAETEVGKTVPVEIWRNEEVIIVDVTIGRLENANLDARASAGQSGPGADNTTTEVASLQISVGELNESLRNQYQIDENITNGVVITNVDDNSEAQKRSLRPGLVILAVNQVSVRNIAEFIAIIEKASNDSRSHVLLLIAENTR